MAYTPGKGTQLQLSIASVFTAIAQLVGVGPPGMTKGTSEVTDLSDDWKRFIASIKDGGEVTLTVEYDAATTTHATLWTKFSEAPTSSNNWGVQDWKVVFADAGAAEVAYSAIITNFKFDDVDNEKVVTAQLTLKISGAVTITP